MTPRKCPECGKRRQLFPITAEEARRFGPRFAGPQPSVGTEFCAACVANPPPGPPRDLAAELNQGEAKYITLEFDELNIVLAPFGEEIMLALVGTPDALTCEYRLNTSGA